MNKTYKRLYTVEETLEYDRWYEYLLYGPSSKELNCLFCFKEIGNPKIEAIWLVVFDITPDWTIVHPFCSEECSNLFILGRSFK
jgi:hypothetical protein